MVDSTGRLTIQNVNFTNNAAIGGNGKATDPIGTIIGGGGGMGGNGGTLTGGGGGLYGNGGSPVNGSGGGGGLLGNGGNGAAFGGGGGGGISSTASTGGFGGGNGGKNLGGSGGAAFGGAVFVRAGGQVTIVNTTSFSGNTVTAGTDFQNGSADGANLFLMRNVSTIFDITGTQSLTFAQTLGNDDGTANAGVTLNKTGTGTLILSGTSSLAGVATVNGGLLAVNGTYGGQVNVNNGGTLSGTGTVGNVTVNSGGAVAPGNSIGTLNINGNFTQSSGSSFNAEVSPTAADKIAATGTATIQNNTTFNVALEPGVYTKGSVYQVLTATSVSGQYTTLNAPSPGTRLMFVLEHGPDTIDLVIVSAPTDFGSQGATFNQQSVGAALDVIGLTATGELSAMIDTLSTLPTADLRTALDRLSGEMYASLGTVEMQSTTAWLQLLDTRLVGQLRPAAFGGTGTISTFDSSENELQLVSYQPANGQQFVPSFYFGAMRRPQWTSWIQGYGQGGSLSSNGNADGLTYGLGGTLFGIDRWFCPNFSAGAFGGYAGTSVHNDTVGSRAQLNDYQVGLQELFRYDRLYALNIDAFSTGAIDSARDVVFPGFAATARGDTSSNQYSHYTEAGFTLGGQGVLFQPFTAAQYVYYDRSGFQETGGGAANLAVGNQQINSFRGNLGARIYGTRTIGGLTLIPMAQARFQHEFGDGTRLINSSFTGAPTTSFAVGGNDPGRDFGLFTLGSQVLWGEYTSLYGGYDLQVANRYAAHLGSLGVQFNW